MKETAIFAGGCFWCMVKPFDQLPGIYSIRSGYTGGHLKNPTYEQVCSGLSGHTEAVKIEFNPEIISYDDLLTIYWQQTDPTDAFGQFQDRGESYQPVIFYTNDDQKNKAEQSRKRLEDSGKYTDPIVTRIEEAKPFYDAEEYHQDFYQKNPERYHATSSERHDFLEKVWGRD